MKTAEELFELHSIPEYLDGFEAFYEQSQPVLKVFKLTLNGFIQALIEHDNEIISKIDEMIKELWAQGCLPVLDEEYQYKIEVLTELKQIIEEKL